VAGLGPGGFVVSTNLLAAHFIGESSGLTNANPATLFDAGTIPADRLGSGSSITTKFLRGDSTWQTLVTGDMLGANNLSDVVSAGLSRSNIFAHIGDNITDGTVAAARLGSGSAITTKFLRGDNTWQTISVLPVTATSYLATNAASGSWMLITKEPDDTWSLAWSAANGFQGTRLYVNPSTGVLHVDCDPFTLDHSLSVAGGITVSALPQASTFVGHNPVVVETATGILRQSGVVNLTTLMSRQVSAGQLVISNLVAVPTTQTNFVLSFTNSDQTLFTANTNVNISFADLTAGGSLTWRVDALTSTVPSTVTLPATVVTNSGLILTVTNGTARVFHAGLSYGALVTSNLWITGGDVYRR
jgi:hypothetical protein